MTAITDPAKYRSWQFLNDCAGWDAPLSRTDNLYPRETGCADQQTSGAAKKTPVDLVPDRYLARLMFKHILPIFLASSAPKGHLGQSMQPNSFALASHVVHTRVLPC
jgi:hypothetical protein